MSWRDEIKVHPAADLFPMMSDDELRVLGEDIKKNGLRNPVVLWQQESCSELYLLDGRNRLDAMEAVGIKTMVLGTPCCMLGVDPWEYVLSANVHRRHLSAEQKRDLIAKVLKQQPQLSNRQIGKATKADGKTVGTIRREMEGRAEIPHVEVREDTKGRQQPADRAALKRERRDQRERELAAKVRAMPDKRYGVILADLPWRFEPYSRKTGMDRAADNHYPTMTTDELWRLKVPAAKDAVLFLWTTVPFSKEAHRLFAVWDFSYVSQFVWVKAEQETEQEEETEQATGYWNRNAHELLLIGKRGNVPAPAPGTQFRSVIFAPTRGHSQKPDRVYEIIEAYFPNVPKIELFARGKARPGWEVWGNEAETPAESNDLDGIPAFLRRA